LRGMRIQQESNKASAQNRNPKCDQDPQDIVEKGKICIKQKEQNISNRSKQPSGRKPVGLSPLPSRHMSNRIRRTQKGRSDSMFRKPDPDHMLASGPTHVRIGRARLPQVWTSRPPRRSTVARRQVRPRPRSEHLTTYSEVVILGRPRPRRGISTSSEGEKRLLCSAACTGGGMIGSNRKDSSTIRAIPSASGDASSIRNFSVNSSARSELNDLSMPPTLLACATTSE
jgi:hypothetical protein